MLDKTATLCYNKITKRKGDKEMAKYHWFFDYEQKEWRIVADNFEAAKNGLANVVGQSYEELSTPHVSADGKHRSGPKVRFSRVEGEAGNIVYKAP